MPEAVLAAIPFPNFDPVAIWLGPLPIRWYALAYIGGLVGGWLYARRLAGNAALWGETKRPDPDALDDLLVYVALGVVLGGRLGYVLFYNPGHFLTSPQDIVKVWQGGMAFHGGLIGAAIGTWIFARRRGLDPLAIFDLCATVVPLGLFFGRIANFINGELWGAETNVPWALVFPDAGPLGRHPSQLYEAVLEGLLLLIVLAVACRRFGFRRPGLLSGIFLIGYGLTRGFSEFFREPDTEWGYLFADVLTIGMIFSIPMILIGLMMISRAQRGAAGTKA